jgi:hypothetical protein
MSRVVTLLLSSERTVKLAEAVTQAQALCIINFGEQVLVKVEASNLDFVTRVFPRDGP